MTIKRDLNKLSAKFFLGNRYSSRTVKPTDHSAADLRNHTATSASAKVTVHFDLIEDVFVELCQRYEIIVGAVAWLTNSNILTAMAKANKVAVVVQKEDFLRRDSYIASHLTWRQHLHTLYADLRPFYSSDFSEAYPGQQEFHTHFNSTVQHWLFNASGEFQRGGEAVTCVGYARDVSGREVPRMHHKFLLFGDQHDGLIMRPACVVTGSFNLSHNATLSRENIVVIEDAKICQSYLSEWAQLWCVSEPLNWSSPEPCPSETDIGT